VRLTNAEITRLAVFLGIPEYRFVQEYTRFNAGRNGLALTEQANGDCVFLEGRDCRVQPVKPDQCREFPNRWRFAGFERLCQAIPEQLEVDGPL
jgi:Fe-S-cluster containining protein